MIKYIERSNEETVDKDIVEVTLIDEVKYKKSSQSMFAKTARPFHKFTIC